MVPEPDFQWTINPFNLLWSIGGALIAGSGLIWAWGRKWQTVESLNAKFSEQIKDLQDSIKGNNKAIQHNKDSHDMEIVRLHAELDVLRDEKAKYRIEAEGKFATRAEVTKLADLVGSLRERLPRLPYPGPGD